MIRKQKIYKILQKLCLSISLEDIQNGFSGFETSCLSEKTGILRNNVSKDLNALVREKRIIKITGHPMYFFDRERLEELLGKQLMDQAIEVDSIAALIHVEQEKPQDESQTDIFEQIIGADLSLEMAIKQAKAAIFYPPRGLHTLLTGPTGSGKTTFAEIMYQYARQVKLLDDTAAFVVFNCAEYADNPQLILSQLFGHARGAFTGAVQEKPGLVEKADKGFLLLDEVHRLPPEGQEMLFTLMDKHEFRRIGETGEPRHAELLLIAATTEDAESVLLKTFLRRIPMVIKLPSLEERTLQERYEFIQHFFSVQSNMVHAPVRVYRDVLKALLSYDCRGNIGQLKSDIQLICARGFLEYKTQKKLMIEIDTPLLQEHVYKGLLSSMSNRQEIFELIGSQSSSYYDFPQKRQNRLFEEIDTSESVYFELINTYQMYSKHGYSQENINQKMNQVVEKYLQHLLKKIDQNEMAVENEKLFKVISPRVYKAVQDGLEIISPKLKRPIDKRMLVALAMHIEALPKRKNETSSYRRESLRDVALNNPEAYDAARELRQYLEMTLKVKIPETEDGFITMFLTAVDTKLVEKKIGVLIMMHGRDTASSIAEVCNSLLGTKHCKAIDMRLDEKIDDVLARAVDIVRNINEGKGVLLLVDMGSLMAFGKVISEQTGVPTETVHMVSTPIALEAVRKSLMPGVELTELCRDLHEFITGTDEKLLAKIPMKRDSGIYAKKIVTVCMTSQGAAVKLAEIIRNAVENIAEHNIVVEPMSIQKIKSLDAEKQKKIFLFVGTLNPAVDGIPWISTDEIVIGNGLERIRNMIEGTQNGVYRKIMIPNMTMEIIEGSLSFLNPQKACSFLEEALDEIIHRLTLKKTDHLRISFLLHCTCMLERAIKKESLPYEDIKQRIQEKNEIYEVLKDVFQKIEESFGMIIPDTEYGYLIDTFDTEKYTEE